jgi:hypothetical protein
VQSGSNSGKKAPAMSKSSRSDSAQTDGSTLEEDFADTVRGTAAPTKEVLSLFLHHKMHQVSLEAPKHREEHRV